MVRLTEVAAPKGLVGGPFGSSLVGADYVDSGIPVIRGSSLSRGRYVSDHFVYVTEEKYEAELARNGARPGDLVFTQRGTLGQVCQVPDEFPRYVISQSQMRLRVDPTVAHADYVYYACLDPAFLKAVDLAAIRTGVPHINLGILGNLHIPLPNLQEQRAIAEVLSALDDEIAANDRLSTSLQTLTDAVGRELLLRDEARVSGTVGDLVTIVNGLSYRSSELCEGALNNLVTLKSVTREGMYAERGLKGFRGNFKAEQRVVPGDIVVAQTDLTQAAEVVGRAIRLPEGGLGAGNAIASLDLAIVRPKDYLEMPREILLAVLRADPFRQHCLSHTSGTTVLHLRRGAIASYPMPNIDVAVNGAFVGRVRTLNARQDAAAVESRALAALRDTLLPELMSGRLRVKDAEQTVEEVV